MGADTSRRPDGGGGGGGGGGGISAAPGAQHDNTAADRCLHERAAVGPCTEDMDGIRRPRQAIRAFAEGRKNAAEIARRAVSGLRSTGRRGLGRIDYTAMLQSDERTPA